MPCGGAAGVGLEVPGAAFEEGRAPRAFPRAACVSPTASCASPRHSCRSASGADFQASSSTSWAWKGRPASSRRCASSRASPAPGRRPRSALLARGAVGQRPARASRGRALRARPRRPGPARWSPLILSRSPTSVAGSPSRGVLHQDSASPGARSGPGPPAGTRQRGVQPAEPPGARGGRAPRPARGRARRLVAEAAAGRPAPTGPVGAWRAGRHGGGRRRLRGVGAGGAGHAAHRLAAPGRLAGRLPAREYAPNVAQLRDGLPRSRCRSTGSAGRTWTASPGCSATTRRGSCT